MSVVVKHNYGFFSCCSVKLDSIVNYINKTQKKPDHVDSSELFGWYKNVSTDITYEYFEHYDNIDTLISFPINYKEGHQFIDYSTLDYDTISPLIKKYFSPSNQILKHIETLEQKYNLVYDNICVLFYRGNDKITETSLSSYESYLTYANKILKENPSILFLIQSDETEFIEFITHHFPNSFYFKDEIRHMKKCNSTVDIVFKEKNVEYSKYYLAITIIMSKCKYIVCGSGNCSIWIMLYRGNNDRVYQYLNGTWLE
jgi:hypothetical protein